MYSLIRSYFKKTLLLAIALAGLAACIWYLNSESLSPSNAFFWVGAVPVMFGTLGMAGSCVGRGNVNFQLSKTTMNASSADRAMVEIEDLKLWQTSTWHWISAGVMLFAISVILP